jgi:hypothetical protein
VGAARAGHTQAYPDPERYALAQAQNLLLSQPKLFHRKISKSWRIFCLQKTRVRNTTFHHPPTTNSPSKHRTKKSQFAKTPSKIAKKQQKTPLPPRPYFFLKR